MKRLGDAAQPAENLRYALLLEWGSRLGLLVLIVSFFAYVSGLLDAHVPVERLPQLWSLPVGRYLELTGSPQGWGWLELIHRGDIAGMAGIAILAGCSLLCLLALIPIYLRRGDRIYAALSALEILVVVLAASGQLTGGH